MSDVQIAIIDQENIEVNLAVPGIQGAKGDTGTVAAAGDGTAGAPGIAFALDTDTGIYRVGSNSIGISTGGTGRLFVDASGNVGIGVSPSAWNTDYRVIQLKGGGALSNDGGNTEVRFSQNTFVDSGSLNKYIASAAATRYRQTSGLHLWEYAASGTAGNTITFNEAARIRADGMFEVKGAGTAGSSPAFSVSGSAPASSLVVDSSGRTGLGTSSVDAGHILQANGVIATVTPFGAFTALQTAGGTGFRWTLTNDGTYRLQRTTDGFSTVTTPIYVDSSSRVGIGTTSPTQKVQITDGSLSNFYIAPGYNSGTGTLLATGGSEYLAFATNGLTNERVRIDSSGRLLVGTSSTSSNNRFIVQSNTDSSTGPGIFLIAKGDNAPVSEGSLGLIRFGGSTHTHSAEIYAIRDGGTWTAGSSLPTAIAFSTTADGAPSPTERMRITSGGNVLIARTSGGLTTAGAGFMANAGGAYGEIVQASNGVACLYLSQNFNSGTQTIADLRYNNTQVGTINVTSSATAYNTSSDYRLKENVVPLTGAIDRVNQLQVHRFNFIADPDKTVDGFIAHEAQAVVPECVTGEKDAVDDEGNPVYQGIDQSKLVPLLTAALQEAIAKIETLEAKVAALEAQ